MALGVSPDGYRYRPLLLVFLLVVSRVHGVERARFQSRLISSRGATQTVGVSQVSDADIIPPSSFVELSSPAPPFATDVASGVVAVGGFIGGVVAGSGIIPIIGAAAGVLSGVSSLITMIRSQSRGDETWEYLKGTAESGRSILLEVQDIIQSNEQVLPATIQAVRDLEHVSKEVHAFVKGHARDGWFKRKVVAYVMAVDKQIKEHNTKLMRALAVLTTAMTSENMRLNLEGNERGTQMAQEMTSVHSHVRELSYKFEKQLGDVRQARREMSAAMSHDIAEAEKRYRSMMRAMDLAQKQHDAGVSTVIASNDQLQEKMSQEIGQMRSDLSDKVGEMSALMKRIDEVVVSTRSLFQAAEETAKAAADQQTEILKQVWEDVDASNKFRQLEAIASDKLTTLHQSGIDVDAMIAICRLTGNPCSRFREKVSGQSLAHILALHSRSDLLSALLERKHFDHRDLTGEEPLQSLTPLMMAALAFSRSDGRASKEAVVSQEEVEVFATSFKALSGLFVSKPVGLETLQSMCLELSKPLLGVEKSGLTSPLRVLQVLLDELSSEEISARTPHGLSALDLAAGGNSPEAVRMLLGKGAQPLNDAANATFPTILHSAAMTGSKEVVLSIIDHPTLKSVLAGPAVDGQSTPLHLVMGQIGIKPVREIRDIVVALFDLNNDWIDAVNEKGETPLMLACRASDTSEIVEALLKAGADVMLPGSHATGTVPPSDRPDSPFARAIAWHNWDAANMILVRMVKFADVSTKKVFLGSWLRLVARELYGIGDGMAQEEAKLLNIAELILRESGNTSKGLVNQQDGAGDTALHIAARADNLDLVQILLKRDVDVTISNKDNQTPIAAALSRCALDVFQLLLKQDPGYAEDGTVNLAGQQLRDQHVCCLASSQIPNAKKLDLSHNDITQEGMSCVRSMLEASESLVEIDLSWNEIGNVGLTMLLTSNRLPSTLALVSAGLDDGMANHILTLEDRLDGLAAVSAEDSMSLTLQLDGNFGLTDNVVDDFNDFSEWLSQVSDGGMSLQVTLRHLNANTDDERVKTKGSEVVQFSSVGSKSYFLSEGILVEAQDVGNGEMDGTGQSSTGKYFGRWKDGKFTQGLHVNRGSSVYLPVGYSSNKLSNGVIVTTTSGSPVSEGSCPTRSQLTYNNGASWVGETTRDCRPSGEGVIYDRDFVWHFLNVKLSKEGQDLAFNGDLVNMTATFALVESTSTSDETVHEAVFSSDGEWAVDLSSDGCNLRPFRISGETVYGDVGSFNGTYRKSNFRNDGEMKYSARYSSAVYTGKFGSDRKQGLGILGYPQIEESLYGIWEDGAATYGVYHQPQANPQYWVGAWDHGYRIGRGKRYGETHNRDAFVANQLTAKLRDKEEDWSLAPSTECPSNTEKWSGSYSFCPRISDTMPKLRAPPRYP